MPLAEMIRAYALCERCVLVLQEIHDLVHGLDIVIFIVQDAVRILGELFITARKVVEEFLKSFLREKGIHLLRCSGRLEYIIAMVV